MFLFLGLLVTAPIGSALGSLLPADRLYARQGGNRGPSASSIGSSTTSSAAANPSSSVLGPVTPGCTNGPSSRGCWSGNFTINTDFDAPGAVNWPTTGVTRYYDFTVTNGTAAPDGFKRLAFLVNGQLPGPTIFAEWGDYIQVTLHNQLQDNGTGIHWHGIRQYLTNPEDGVPGLTECPLAPGDSKVYKFQATQHGTSWWHTHVSTQYGDGIWGPIVIHGPTSANYDVDLGAFPINDWYYKTAWSLTPVVAHTLGPPPSANNGLMNGTMISQYGGAYYVTNVTKGKKYLIRFINSAVDNSFVVSIDNHQMLVITSDFIPIKPQTVTTLFIGIGQRYSVVITANQAVGNYWFRAENQLTCGQFNSNNGNIKSILRYAGASSTNPTSQAYSYQPTCSDPLPLTPYFGADMPSQDDFTQGDLDVDFWVDGASRSGNLVYWGINSSALYVLWDKPTLEFVMNGNLSFPRSENVIQLPTGDKWYYWIITQYESNASGRANVPHPIHLHGHDFRVLGTGSGTFTTSDISSLNWSNPTRRDVAMLPSDGWLIVAFHTGNPGAWLMHCHIAWHGDEGLAVQFLEMESQIGTLAAPATSLQQTCNNWEAYVPHAAYQRLPYDSGV